MRLRIALTLALLVVLAVPTPAGSAVVRCAGETPTLVGTAGPDDLEGTAGRDVIAGLGGNDVIAGLDGDDVICGGDGDDVLGGGDGVNLIWGDAGNDRLRGGPEFDILRGGSGDDVLDPGGGPTTRLYGDDGRDRLVLHRVQPGDFQFLDGGLGRDTLDLRLVPAVTRSMAYTVSLDLSLRYPNLRTDDPEDQQWAVTEAGFVVDVEVVLGTAGNDALLGDDEPNTLRGGAGTDVLQGQGGSDRLFGEAGRDFLMGGNGNDRLDGGAGTEDNLDGGGGADTCVSGETVNLCES